MVSRRLVLEIERNAHKLAVDLVEAVRQDRNAEAYRHLTDAQFQGVVLDLYANLGEWLQSRTWNKLRHTYERKGRERCHGTLPLEQLIYSLTKTKTMLLDFIRGSLPGDSSERDMELQLILSVSEFFDRAIYHTIAGYEDARRTSERVSAETAAKPAVISPPIKTAAYAGSASVAEGEVHLSRGGDLGEVSG